MERDAIKRTNRGLGKALALTLVPGSDATLNRSPTVHVRARHNRHTTQRSVECRLPFNNVGRGNFHWKVLHAYKNQKVIKKNCSYQRLIFFAEVFERGHACNKKNKGGSLIDATRWSGDCCSVATLRVLCAQKTDINKRKKSNGYPGCKVPKHATIISQICTTETNKTGQNA